MQGGKYQVSGEGGVHGGFRSFQIADLPYEYGVRVLPHDGTQAIGKIISFFGIHLCLLNAGEVIFNRVFNGDDFDARIVNGAEKRVERGGFARTSGAGGEDEAVGLFQFFFHGFSHPRRHA